MLFSLPTVSLPGLYLLLLKFDYVKILQKAHIYLPWITVFEDIYTYRGEEGEGVSALNILVLLNLSL